MSSAPNPRSPKSGLLLSVAFHAVALGILIWVAAHEGLFQPPQKSVTVTLVPEPEPEQQPIVQPTQPPSVPAPQSVISEQPTPSFDPQPNPEPSILPSEPHVPSVAAPPPVDVPQLVFNETTETSGIGTGDSASYYRKFIEFTLRTHWNRPADIDDHTYVAELVIAVDSNGSLRPVRWERNSGNKRWDNSVLNAVKETQRIERVPPNGFPPIITIRFDVVSPDVLKQ